jgi:hypothetical protein
MAGTKGEELLWQTQRMTSVSQFQARRANLYGGRYLDSVRQARFSIGIQIRARTISPGFYGWGMKNSVDETC